MKGIGEERVVKWERKASVSYVHCRTNKGDIQNWRHKRNNSKHSSCRFRRNHMETGEHIALVCPYGEEIGRRWSSWKEMDEKKK